jgi:hypothetical protein
MFEQIRGWLAWLLSLTLPGARRARPGRRWLLLESLEARLVPTQYFFDPTNPLPGDGTIGNPWQNLSSLGATVLNAGDQLLLKKGTTFTGQSLTLTSANISPQGLSSPVLITGYGADVLPVPTITTGTGRYAVGIFLENVGSVHISGLRLTGSFTNTMPDPTQGQADLGQYGILCRADAYVGVPTLRGIAVDNVEVAGYAGFGISVEDPAWASGVQYSGVSISASNIHNNWGSGVFLYATFDQPVRELFNVYVGYVYVHDNHPYVTSPQTRVNGNAYGIYLQNVVGGVVEHCVDEHNEVTTNFPPVPGDGPADSGYAGIEAYFADRVLFQFNAVLNSYTTRPTDADGAGFDFDLDTTSSVMQYNYTEGNAGAGFLLSQIHTDPPVPPNSGSVLRFNVSQDDDRTNNYGGIALTGGLIQNAQIYDNTVYTSSPQSAQPGNPGAAFDVRDLDALPTNVKVYNNIFAVSTNISYGTNRSPYAIFSSTALQASNIEFQRNDYYNFYQGSITPALIAWGNMISFSAAAWAAANPGQETAGTVLAVDPGFATPPQPGQLGLGPRDSNGGDISGTLNQGFSAYRLSPRSLLLGQGLNLNDPRYHVLWDPYGFASDPFLGGYFSPAQRDFFGNPGPQGNWNVGIDLSPLV